MKKYFLFDLDGTLADTGEGVTKCVQYALTAFGFPPQPPEALRRFVGPPLHWSFEEYYGLTPEQAVQAVEKYRERYRTKGILESPLYPGMAGLLERLSQKAILCLATSKPLVYAKQILEMRGIALYFAQLSGAELDGTRTDKAEVIAHALHLLGDPPKDQAVMVGDRRHDILGANAHGLDSIGALYGYSEPNELQTVGATYLAATVPDLERLCTELT